jgi:hypothetical protein
MTPTDPQDDIPASMPEPVGAPDDGAATIPSEAPPAPEEETNEQWMHRFIAENAHLARPRPERPPPPPPSPWDGPISSWKVPDHLSLRHPNGGYMAMALFSRTMDDLDEVTKGERAATYEEVDKYFGHALIAEGLVPFTFTADEAIRWWKSGGYRVLGASANVQPPAQTTSDETPASRRNQTAGSSIDMNANGTMIDDPTDPAPFETSTADGRGMGEAVDMLLSAQAGADPASLGAPGSQAYRRVIAGEGLEHYRDRETSRKLLPEAEVPLAFPRVRTTFRTDSEWVIAAKIKADDIPRLSQRTHPR